MHAINSLSRAVIPTTSLAAEKKVSAPDSSTIGHIDGYIVNPGDHKTLEELYRPKISIDVDEGRVDGYGLIHGYFKGAVIDQDSRKAIDSVEGKYDRVDNVDATYAVLKGSFTDLKTGEKNEFTGNVYIPYTTSGTGQITTTSGEHINIFF